MLAYHLQSLMSKHVFFWTDRKGMSNTTWAEKGVSPWVGLMLCKRKIFIVSHKIWANILHLCNVSLQNRRDYLSPPTSDLLTVFQVNNWYGTPCCSARWLHHSTTNWPLLMQTKVVQVQLLVPVLTVTPIISPSPQPHTHWLGAATDIELQMGTSMSQSRRGWDTGCPPQRTPCSPINWSLLDLRWWFRGTL